MKKIIAGILAFTMTTALFMPYCALATDEVSEVDMIVSNEASDAADEVVFIEDENATSENDDVVEIFSDTINDAVLPENIDWIGNTADNIINGGIMAEYDNVFYYADEKNNGALSAQYTGDGDIAVLSDDDCKNINISSNGEILYYTVDTDSGSDIKCHDGASGINLLYHYDSIIKQMYLVNNTLFYFLSDGSVYCYNSETGDNEIVNGSGDILSFVPTEYGIIYVKGSLFDYKIYANDILISENILSYQLEDNILVLVKADETYQVALEKAFNNFTENDIEAYQFADDEVVLFSESEAENIEDDLSSATILDESYELEDNEEDISFPVELFASGKQNVVKRARQQAEIKWTPKKNVKGYSSNTSGAAKTFKAGTTYKGIPYGQLVQSGKYVPHSYSLNNFAKAVDDTSSAFYTKRGKYSSGNKDSTYYASDCSAFVSWSYGLSRMTTSSIGSSSKIKKVSSQSIYSAQVGDCLNKSGSHVVLITDLVYNSSGNLSKVVITEQTPPQVKKSTYSPSTVTSKYLKKGYVLRRYSDIGSVKYTHSCAVPIDGDTCSSCNPKPSKPTFSSISATSTTALTLKWKAAANATSYEVYRKKEGGSYSKITTVSGTSYKDTGLSVGTKYYYYINAKNSKGTTKSNVLNSYTKPNKPTISKVERVSTSKLKITWGKVSSADSYIIKRRRGDKDDYEQIKTTTATSFTDTGLKGGARYWYRVYAVKGNVKSDRSETAGNFTQMKAPSISVSTANTISMSWEKAIGTNKYAYEVYYKKATEPDSSYKKIATTSYTGGTSQKLEPGTMYNYKIKVIVENTGGYCTWSNVATGMTLFDKPKVTTLGDTSLKIEWSKLQGKGSYQYGLYRKVATDTTNKTSTRVATLTDTSYTDTGLTPGESYYYKFVVEDKNNNLKRVSYSAIGAGTTTNSSGLTFVIPDGVFTVLKGTVYDEADGEIKDAIDSIDEDLEEGIIDESDESPNEIEEELTDSMEDTSMFGDEGELPVEIVNATVDDTGASLTFIQSTEIGDAKIIVAEYDDNQALLSLYMIDKADCETNTNEEGVTEYTASFPGVTSSNVKFFVWDSISSLRPLANSVSATYNDMQDDPEVSTDTDNLEGEL